ncbi:MAG: 2'-5' RNA ligase family protein [Chloroflexi bacterium]|nr:2'-5' RNA ligase family protein [Chloroflexota bacterium]
MAAPSADPRDAENDRHGFAVYAVFAVAGSAQVAAIGEIRRAMLSGSTNPPAYATAPAHVTVKRLFAGFPNVGQVQEAIHAVAESTPPFRIEFDGGPEPHDPCGSSLAVPVKTTPELIALNRSLESAISPLVEKEFGGIDFRPHMTVFQDASPEESERGIRLARGLRLGSGFQVEALELMARTAPFRGGRWQSLMSFDLDIWGAAN